MNEDTTGFIYPCFWADYLAKVAETTLLPVTFVWHKMALAQGLQYVMVWNHRNGYRNKHNSTSGPSVRLDQPL